MPIPLRRVRFQLTVSLLVTVALAEAFSLTVSGQQAAPSIRDLAWMAGSWRMAGGETLTEEHWTDVGGNMMLGVGRTLVGGKTVFFEFLRIEERADGIFYVAQPRGRPGTDFKLTRLEGTSAIFENPQHDFPKRVLYRRNTDGSITARVDGGQGVEKGAEEFHYQPMKKP